MEHYVIRLWVPADEAGAATDDPGLHGVVSHVSSGRTETFRDGRELLRQLIDLRRPPVQGPAEDRGSATR